MSRYFIIDIEHIKSCFKSQIAAQKAIDQLVYNPLVLSEEESLAKFKEVWEASWEAYSTGVSSDCVHSTEDDWEEFKKTL